MTNRKFMYKLCFFVVFLFLSSASYAQCKNSISLKKVSNETKSGKGGVIDVLVNGSGAYVCVLNIEKGSGPEKISEKRGTGNSVIHFEKLEINEIYQVQVEFLNEDKTHCKKLVKPLITFDVE